MKSDLHPNETIVHKGAANLQKGIEAVGGKLFLTDQRVVFESHALNVQTGTTEIPLAEIQRVQPCWTKFLNLIPLIPNSLAIQTRDGSEYKFVLFGRSRWKLEIENQLHREPRTPQ